MMEHQTPRHTAPPEKAGFPKNLLIETTTRCNLRCKQCARLENRYALADLEMETFHRLAPLFPHLREVALYGHGETFLHTQFFTMLEELKKHGIFVYVTTNGMLVREDVAERLVDLQLDRLSFSLDAATPDLFNEIRLGAKFEKIIGNIRRLNAIKKQAHRDDRPVLSIMYCAMKSNIQELPKLVRLAHELNMLHGVAVINITEYDAVAGECLTRYPELATRYLNEAVEVAEKLAIPLELPGPLETFVRRPVRITLWEKVLRNYGEFQRSFDRKTLLRTKLSRLVQRSKAVFSSERNRETSPEQTPAPPETPTIRVRDCRDPWDFLFVNVHGDVRVCCVSHRVMGNVHQDDITTIWHNGVYQEFRRRILSEDPPEECQTCPMRGWHEIPAL